MRPIVVVGDSLLDVDLTGRASRLVPDAPAPVLEDLVEQARPGGAALAAELAARGGRDVVLVTAWSDDAAGERLVSLLSPNLTLVRVPGGATPVKRRVRAQGHTLLRLDSGSDPGSYLAPDDDRLDVIGEAAAVLASDYGRGLLAQESVRRALGLRGAPLVWDPHPRGPVAVPRARLLTPNASELQGLTEGEGDPEARARRLVDAWRADAVAVTLGEEGALLVTADGVPGFAPAPRTTAVDTCGAGDCFAAAATVSLSGGALVSEAVQAAVKEAAAFVANGAAASLGRVVDATEPGAPGRRADRVVATGGCFDLLHAGHVASLENARRLGDRLVVCLNSDASVRRLKGPTRPVVPAEDRARVLSALSCVDEVVIFDEDTPVEVLRKVRPQIWAKGGDYDASSLPEARVLAEWGGRAVVLPYLTGRSTTDLVHTVSTREGSMT